MICNKKVFFCRIAHTSIKFRCFEKPTKNCPIPSAYNLTLLKPKLVWCFLRRLEQVRCLFRSILLIVIRKGQLNSAWIYEVIISPKMQTKNYRDFYPTKQTRMVAKKNCLPLPKNHQKKVLRSLAVWQGKNPCNVWFILGETMTS